MASDDDLGMPAEGYSEGSVGFDQGINPGMSKETPGVRYAEVDRETKETRVHVVLDLDGGTRRDIHTGVPFFDHMLQQFAFHGLMDVGISAEGDLQIDDHHTVEDVGIVLGKALRQAISAGEGIVRYASATVPMDDALVQCVVDISGRGGFYHNLTFKRENLGTLSTECVAEFFKSVCVHGGITMHMRQIAGENDHHVCEAAFKAFGQAMVHATRRSERRGAPSTKGKLD